MKTPFMKNSSFYTWLKRRKLSDYIFAAFLILFLITRIPAIADQFKKQGTKLNPLVIDNKVIPPPGFRSALIFWASWCGPCSIELKRIQKAISAKELPPANIYAVNMGENETVVAKAVHEQNLNMPIVRDSNGVLANTLNVKATPTVVLVDELGRIEWVTSGLSPTLIYRMKYFLK